MMTSRFQKIVATVTVMIGLSAFVSATPVVKATSTNGGAITTPDSGASLVLLALGCSGLAVAAGKRFKRS